MIQDDSLLYNLKKGIPCCGKAHFVYWDNDTILPSSGSVYNGAIIAIGGYWNVQLLVYYTEIIESE